MKSICYLLTLFIIHLYHIGNAQIKDPKQFSGWDKKIIFEDNFNDDHNDWLKDSSDVQRVKDKNVETKVAIAQGYLTYEVIKGDKPYAAAIKLDFDYDRDFEIEYCFKVITADKRYKVASTCFWDGIQAIIVVFCIFQKWEV